MVGIFFLTRRGMERSFIVASNEDSGAKHDVSLSLLLGELSYKQPKILLVPLLSSLSR